jgi:macrolide-specific efflux system membrane fusion protein
VNRRASGVGLAAVAIVGLGLSLTGADGDAAPRDAANPAVASDSPATSPSPSPPALPAPSSSAMPFVASSGVAVQLNFSSPGVLTAVMVKVGDHVTKGQALATLDTTAARIAVTSAQANADKAKNTLAALTQGLTPQELAQLNLGETQAAAAVTNAQQAVTDAQAQADQDAATQNSLLIAAQQSLTDTEAQASQDATDSAQQVTVAQAQLAADQAATHPDPVKIAADTAAVVAAQENQATSALHDTQQVHAATANVTNAQNSAAAAALHDAQAIHQAQANVTAQQQQLDALKASDAVRTEPPRSTALASARDDLTGAQAQLQSAQLALAATTLHAPAAGVIAAITAVVGESVGSGATAFISLEEPGSS